MNSIFEEIIEKYTHGCNSKTDIPWGFKDIEAICKEVHNNAIKLAAENATIKQRYDVSNALWVYCVDQQSIEKLKV